MNLYIKKQVNKEEKSLICEMLNVVTLSDNTNLLLVDRSEMGFSNVKEGVNTKNIFFKIYKIQFICKCDIDIAKGLIIAFFIDANGELAPYILSDLPGNYYQDSFEVGNCLVVDYKSYLEICEYTNEKPVSIYDFISSKINCDLDPNSILEYEGKSYNRDESVEVYNKIQSK